MWCSGKWSSTCYNSSSKRSSSHQCSVWKCVFRAIAKKVKCTLVQALRLCTGRTAHRGSRGITLLFLDHGTRRGWGVSATPRPLFTPGKDPVPIVQEVGWVSGAVWTGAENLAPPPGFDPRTVQPIASRYTDWAIPAHKLYMKTRAYFWSHIAHFFFISSDESYRENQNTLFMFDKWFSKSAPLMRKCGKILYSRACQR